MDAFMRMTKYTNSSGLKQKAIVSTLSFKNVLGHKTLALRIFPRGSDARMNDGIRADDMPAVCRRRGELHHVDEGYVALQIIASTQYLSGSEVEDKMRSSSGEKSLCCNLYSEGLTSPSTIPADMIPTTMGCVVRLLGILSEYESYTSINGGYQPTVLAPLEQKFLDCLQLGTCPSEHTNPKWT